MSGNILDTILEELKEINEKQSRILERLKASGIFETGMGKNFLIF